MGDFKKLLLDVNKIAQAIQGFAAGKQVLGPLEKGKNCQEYEIEGEPDTPSALLQVFLREDGTVTLHHKVGKNQALSERVAEHVANCAKRTTFEPRPLSLKQLPEEHWNALLELLSESGFTLSEQKIQHGVRFSVKGGAADEVFLHRFKTGSFLMQGKPWNVYGMVVSILSELSEDKKPIILAQLESYEITNVTSDGLLNELEERMPCACSMLGDGVKCMMAPALAFLKLDIELPDYSAFAHPVLRGMEACMKQLLLEKAGCEVKNKDGFRSVFDKGRLKNDVRVKVGCHKTIGALEKLYDLYNKHRPGLFHSDSVPEMSRLIESRKEAVALIETVFHTVESNYREIANAQT